MATTLNALKPAATSTVRSTRPVVEFFVGCDENDKTVKLKYWISTSPDPSADVGATTVTYATVLAYTGFTKEHYFAFALPAGVDLTPGTWYIEGHVLSATDVFIAGTTNQFTVSLVPAVEGLSPSSGAARPFVNTTNNFMVSWKFAGYELALDRQTAYQVIVNKVSDQTVVVDTGKVVSSNNQAIVSIPLAQQNVQLSWKVRVWNKWDVASIYYGNNIFTLTSAFTLAITSPTNNQVLATGNPNVTTTITIGGGRTAQVVNASAWAGNTKVWEKSVVGNWATAASVNVTAPDSVFFTGTTYTYKVVAKDNLGTFSSQASANFTVNYALPATPPAAPAVATTDYTTLGYVTLTWSDSTRDVDFYRWKVERKADLIDVYTQAVITAGNWTEIGSYYGTATTYTFKDSLSPSNYRVSYRYRQVAVKYGSDVQSNPSAASAVIYPSSDTYWLLGGANGDPLAVSIPLWNVNSDSFTDETESNSFVLIGRGRYVEKGSRLGVNGTLGLGLKDGGGYTARQKRIIIEDFKELYSIATLRSPFGDEYLVSLSDVSIEFEAGRGKAEVTVVTIPYVEVVE